MLSLNNIVIAGNLTFTPELRSTPGGTKLADFTIAINESWTDSAGVKHDGVVFVDGTAWGKLAETLCAYKKQGESIVVIGRLQQDKWIDKETGKNRTKLKVVADHIKFGERRSEKPEEKREAEKAAKRDGAAVGAKAPAGQESAPVKGSDFQPVPDAEKPRVALPF